MIEIIILALLAARLKGHKLKPLFTDWPIYLVLSFTAIYLVFQAGVFSGNYSLVQYADIFKILYLSSFIAMIIKYGLYKQAIIGSTFVILGGVLNDIAIRANNGKMPVFPTLSYWTGYVSPEVFSRVEDIHSLGNADVHLKFLTDIIDIGYSILSVGDLFIRVFPFLIIYAAVKMTSAREGQVGL